MRPPKVVVVYLLLEQEASKETHAVRCVRPWHIDGLGSVGYVRSILLRMAKYKMLH